MKIKVTITAQSGTVLSSTPVIYDSRDGIVWNVFEDRLVMFDQACKPIKQKLYKGDKITIEAL
jgi:hypothetical protein